MDASMIAGGAALLLSIGMAVSGYLVLVRYRQRLDILDSGPKRITELENEVAALRERVEQLTILNNAIVSLNADLTRERDRLRENQSLMEEENRTLRRQLREGGLGLAGD